jgi:hypothetical protein
VTKVNRADRSGGHSTGRCSERGYRLALENHSYGQIIGASDVVITCRGALILGGR